MKWLLALLIFPTLSWAACEGLKQAIENCTPYACEIILPKMGKIGGHKVIGREGAICIIETEGGNPKAGKDLGEICHVNEKALPVMAESVAGQLELMNLMMNLNADVAGEKAGDAILKDMDAFQKKMDLTLKNATELSKKLVAVNGGKAPCVPKDVASMGKFMEMASGLKDDLLPLMFSAQSIDKDKFKKLFPDGKAACVVSMDFRDLNTAHRIESISTQEECKKLETVNCSTLFKISKLKNIPCPAEINIAYSEADKAQGGEVKTVPSTLIKSMVCEINGLMRTKKSITFDPAFKIGSKNFCKKPKGYTCTARLMSKDETVELDSMTKVMKERDGAEVNCLKLAKKLARPHCENPTRELFAEIRLVVDSRTDLSSVLMNQTFPNFCYTHRLKKVFH